jgi:hypothetical protein
MNLIARGVRARSLGTGARALAAVSVLATLAACGSQPEGGPITGSRISAHRPSTYDPPGPSSDPWGPYIAEASARFDVPQRWIREVMRQESGGRTAATSRVGAMGLLQLMPGTYAELRAKHGLGDDPYHPWDNIMAGTAYIREMYDLYGSPGFLAAYNGGPRRLENYLWGGRSLPDETRNYVARIGPRIQGTSPNRRAPEEVYAAAELPLDIPRGPRRGDTATMLALREQRRAADPGIQVASLPAGQVVRMDPIPDGSTAAYNRPPAAAPVQSQLASLGPNVIRMDPIPDGSTAAYNPPRAAAPAQSQLASLGPNVIRMDPIPDGSTYAAEPAPVVVARMDPIPDPPAAAPAPTPTPSRPAMAAEMPRPAPARPMMMAEAPRPAPGPERPASRGFFLVAPAHAGTLPAPATRSGGLPPGVLRAAVPAAASGGNWAIQVGAFASENLARDAAGQARSGAGNGRPLVMAVAQGRSTLYRARVTGLSRDAAQTACERLRGRGACMVISPDA